MSKITWHQSWCDDMGIIPAVTCSTSNPMESPEEEWLWHTNAMRDHDGLPRLTLEDFRFNRTKGTVTPLLNLKELKRKR